MADKLPAALGRTRREGTIPMQYNRSTGRLKARSRLQKRFAAAATPLQEVRSHPIFDPLESRRLCSVSTFTNNSVVNVQDAGTVSSSIIVNGANGSVADADVRIDLMHFYDADLDLTWITPAGRRIDLASDLGGAGDGYRDTTFDDEASMSILSGSAPFTGRFRPEGSLSIADGENPNGTWRLEIADDTAQNGGWLNTWTLSLDTRTTSTVQANLLPYKPSAWSDKIVVSTAAGTNTDASAVYDDQDIYIDWAVANFGTGAAGSFYTNLYVDGVQKGRWSTGSLSANFYTYVADKNIGRLSAGSHTIRIVTDVDGIVGESNEGDNAFTKTITVLTRSNFLKDSPALLSAALAPATPITVQSAWSLAKRSIAETYNRPGGPCGLPRCRGCSSPCRSTRRPGTCGRGRRG